MKIPLLQNLSHCRSGQLGTFVSWTRKHKQSAPRLGCIGQTSMNVTKPQIASTSLRSCHRFSYLRRQNFILSGSASGLLALQPTDEQPSVLLAVAAIVGLPAALWTYKCLMMVIFQRKIIYMGYAPPGARTEELGKDVKVPSGIDCEETQIQSVHKVVLHGIVIRRQQDALPRDPDVVVVYLQGNASNPLARLPVFEKLLSCDTQSPMKGRSLDIAVVAFAPRSYWKSSPKAPTQAGLLADYKHALSFAMRRYPNPPIVLYGHSLGGAVAVCLAAQLRGAEYSNVRGLILENPFSSIPGMVEALYPQTWLPYRYLAPLAFDKWDAVSAMRTTADKPESLLTRLSKDMFVLLSEKDEMVPTSMGSTLYESTLGVAAPSQKDRDTAQVSPRQVIINGALHENGWMQRQWSIEMAAYLRTLVLSSRRREEWCQR